MLSAIEIDKSKPKRCKSQFNELNLRYLQKSYLSNDNLLRADAFQLEGNNSRFDRNRKSPAKMERHTSINKKDSPLNMAVAVVFVSTNVVNNDKTICITM